MIIEYVFVVFVDDVGPSCTSSKVYGAYREDGWADAIAGQLRQQGKTVRVERVELH